VNYLSGAIGEEVFAEGRVLKRGREIIYSDVRVTNAAGKLLAQGTVVYRIVERGQEGAATAPGAR
jgi:acyl-CoA thioesterase